MQASLVEIPNGFEPYKHKVSALRRKLTIRNVLRKHYSPTFVEFDRPTIILVNGVPVLRKDWDTRVIKNGDVMTIISQVGFPPIYLLWALVILLIVAVVVLAMAHKLSNLTQPQTSPAYTLQGKNNQEKLGNPIEVNYGKQLIFPSYAAQPYNQYIGNSQYLFQFFCVGQGFYNITELFIGTTPVANYPEITYEIVPPGSKPTLFPTNVLTSSDVSNIQLLGTNQTGYVVQGPFVANPSGAPSYALRLEVDISFPAGLYKGNSDGSLSDETVTWMFSYQQIDDVTGAPIGAPYNVPGNSTYSTTTPQRQTISWTPPVPNARWEVSAWRTNAHDTATGASDELVWDAMRCFCPDAANYGNVTCIGVKALADFNLNDQSAQEFNILAERMLPIYDIDTNTWSAPTATRSPIWAFCDMAMAAYGPQLITQYLDMVGLVALNDLCIENSYYFDWTFDQSTTFWEAAKLLALVIRSTPILTGPVLGLVRDTKQTIPVAMFGPENMVKGSFQWQIKLPGYDYNDGIELTYQDGDDGTYLPIITECQLPDIDEGNNPLQVFLYGCTNLVQAWREGMYQRAVAYYLRENIVFSVGLEGFIPSYGDLCVISCDIPRWAVCGLVIAAVNEGGSTWALTLNNAVQFSGGGSGSTYMLAVRYKNSTMKGPWAATAGADSTHITINAPDWPSDMPFDGINEVPIFFFGPTSDDMVGYLARLIGIAPNTDDTVQLTFCNYNPAVYSFDVYDPPAPGNNQGSLPPPSDLPVVTGLMVTPSPFIDTQAIASWRPTPQATSYLLQQSYDGETWTTINANDNKATSVSFSVVPQFLYVRVAAINSGQGPFDYWFGDAPTPIPPVPSGFTAVAGIGKSINLSWNPLVSSQSLFYAIYRNTVNNFSTATEIATVFLGNTYIDAPLTPLTQYFYWIEAVNYASVASGPSAVVSAITVNSPPDPNTPAAPAAASVTAGVNTGTDGTVLAFFDVTVPGPAAGVVMVQVQYKLHSAGSTGWMVAAECKTASIVRISDVLTGTLYDIQTVAFDAYYTASSPTVASGNPFSVTKGTSPTQPTAITGHMPSAAYPVSPAFLPGTQVQLFAGMVTFLQATDTDIAGYQYGIGGTSFPVTIPGGASVNQFPVYTAVLSGGQHVFMRSYNSSGVYSSWVDSGIELNTFVYLLTGTMASQDTNSTQVSSITTGNGGGSNVAITARAPFNSVVTLAGGMASETFYIPISGQGFTTKPDGTAGPINVSSDLTLGAVYNWDDSGNSSTQAAVEVAKFGGGNTSAGPVRLIGEFIAY